MQDDGENELRGYIFKGSGKRISFGKVWQFAGKQSLDEATKVTVFLIALIKTWFLLFCSALPNLLLKF